MQSKRVSPNLGSDADEEVVQGGAGFFAGYLG